MFRQIYGMVRARIHNSTSLLAALVFWATAGGALAGPASPMYSLNLIQTPAGWAASVANGINDSGQIVGYVSNTNGSVNQAFIGTVAGITPIPLPAGWTSSQAYGINNSGQIVGNVTNGTKSQAFIGTAAGITPIPLPAGWSESYAFGINNSGQVVGWVWNGGVTTQAFIGTAAGITPLALPTGWVWSQGYGINDSGQIVGYGVASNGNIQAFIGTAAGITPIPLAAGWPSSSAVGINNSGQVAGYVTSSSGGLNQAFIGTAAGITPLPHPAGLVNSEVFGINNSGQVVGYVYDGGNNTEAFISTAAGITPIPLPTGWTEVGALGINDSGQVVGFGTHISTGFRGSILLMPVCQVSAPSISQSGATTATNAGGTWGALPYDQLGGETIAGRGSALTSLNMALNFLGQSWNPATLNSLLDSVPGGYTSRGSVNWGPATAATIGGSTASPVAFSDLGGWVDSDANSGANLNQAIAAVEKGICASPPLAVIVGVRSQISQVYDQTVNNVYVNATHFVLVTGEIINPDGTKALTINDPAYPTTIIGIDESTGESGYLSPTTGNAEFTTRGVVHDPIDLTALSFSVDAVVNLTVTDPNRLQSGSLAGNPNPIQNIPNSGAGVDEIDDDVTGNAGSPVQSVMINSPATGVFQFSLTGVAAGPYSLEVDAEASDGSVQSFSFSGLTNVGTTATYQLVYSPTPGAVAQPALLSSCDVEHNGSINVTDVQRMVNEVLGVAGAVNDLNGDGVVTVVDAQIEINAALGSGCTAQ